MPHVHCQRSCVCAYACARACVCVSECLRLSTLLCVSGLYGFTQSSAEAEAEAEEEREGEEGEEELACDELWDG